MDSQAREDFDRANPISAPRRHPTSLEYVVEVSAGYEVVFAAHEVLDLRNEDDGTLVVETTDDETKFYPGVLVRWFMRESTP